MGEPQITDGDRYQWMLSDPNASRHLLSLLSPGKGDEAAFNAFIDRLIHAGLGAKSGGERHVTSNADLVQMLIRVHGMARGLIVSHRVGSLYPGDDLRLKDQLTRAEVVMADAGAAIEKVIATEGETEHG